jgi:hypothetical protein
MNVITTIQRVCASPRRRDAPISRTTTFDLVTGAHTLALHLSAGDRPPVPAQWKTYAMRMVSYAIRWLVGEESGVIDLQCENDTGILGALFRALRAVVATLSPHPDEDQKRELYATVSQFYSLAPRIVQEATASRIDDHELDEILSNLCEVTSTLSSISIGECYDARVLPFVYAMCDSALLRPKAFGADTLACVFRPVNVLALRATVDEDGERIASDLLAHPNMLEVLKRTLAGACISSRALPTYDAKHVDVVPKFHDLVSAHDALGIKSMIDSAYYASIFACTSTTLASIGAVDNARYLLTFEAVVLNHIRLSTMHAMRPVWKRGADDADVFDTTVRAQLLGGAKEFLAFSCESPATATATFQFIDATIGGDVKELAPVLFSNALDGDRVFRHVHFALCASRGHLGAATPAMHVFAYAVIATHASQSDWTALCEAMLSICKVLTVAHINDAYSTLEGKTVELLLGVAHIVWQSSWKGLELVACRMVGSVVRIVGEVDRGAIDSEFVRKSAFEAARIAEIDCSIHGAEPDFSNIMTLAYELRRIDVHDKNPSLPGCHYPDCRVLIYDGPHLTCAKCATARYDSPDCQLKAWESGHRESCEARDKRSVIKRFASLMLPIAQR